MNASRYLPFAGRLLIGLPFAMSALSKLAAYGPTTEMIGAVGLPAPSLAFAVAVVVEWWWITANLRLPGSPRRGRASSFLLGDCGFVSQQLRRPESNDPLPQEHHDRGRPASDRGLWRGCHQCRQPPVERRRGHRQRGGGSLNRVKRCVARRWHDDQERRIQYCRQGVAGLRLILRSRVICCR